MTGALASGQGEPPNWPDATALKISQVYDPDDNAPVGFNYFRKTINVPTTDVYRIFLSADDALRLWIDGTLVLGKTDIIGKTTQHIDLRLGAGNHLFAAEVENYAGGVYNIIWLMLAMYALNQDGTLGALIAHSDATWKALGFTDPPGFTAHEVLGFLLDEAQARGAVPELTMGGSATLDVAGTAWPVDTNLAFRIGLDGLSVLRQLAETHIDAAMDPASMRLDLWVRGNKGGTPAVVLAAGVNLIEAVHEGGKPDTTTLLNRWSEGWHETTDAVLEAIDRRETFLSQGATNSTVEAEQVAVAHIDVKGRPTERMTAMVARGVGVDAYDDYTTGDTITGPDRTGAPESYRALSFTVTEDADGKVSVTPELELTS